MLKNPLEFLEDISRLVKYFWQRRTRGWDDRDIWSLDYTVSKFVLPRLKLLKKVKNGTPVGMFDHCVDPTRPTDDEEKEAIGKWERIMDEMIWAHQFVVDECEDFVERSLEDQMKCDERCRKGLELFGQHYLSLWD